MKTADPNQDSVQIFTELYYQYSGNFLKNYLQTE